MNYEEVAKLPLLGKVLIVSYILLSPFYFWGSGLPQISDFVLLLLIGWSMTNAFDKKARPISYDMTPILRQNHVVVLALFTYHALLINVGWALLSPEATAFIRSSTFLIFNLATMITFTYLYIHFRHQLVEVLYKSLSVSLWLQTVLSLTLMGTQVGRTVVFFNNPNQLGYFALLTAALLTILYAVRTHRGGVFQGGIHYLNLFACLVVSSVSLSRAALLATAFILICSLIFDSRGIKIRLRLQVGKLVSLAIILSAVAFLFKSTLTDLLDAWDRRIEHKGLVSGDGLSDRGYDRIAENPQYWFLGAGEGGLDRFDTSIELHSLIGNTFFSYGIIGASLFITAVLIIVRRNHVSLIAFTGVFLYGLSHNGMRDGYLWILLGISGAAVVAATSKVGGKEPTDQPPIRVG